MIIEALYLPQFHTFKENDLWWGQGFTEWKNLESSISLHKKHNPIKSPLWGKYDLLDENVMGMQYEFAKEIGVDVFSMYHYWSDGHLLMEKPIQNLLLNKEIDFKFYFNWANHHFFNKVHFSKKKLLWKQSYNDMFIERHVDYIHKAMEDYRYHRLDGKPVFNIYDPRNVPNFDIFFTKYKELFLKKFGTEIHLRATLKDYMDYQFIESNKELIDSVYEYHPVLANHHNPFQHYSYEINLRLKRDIFKRLTLFDSKKIVKRIIKGSKKIQGLPYGFGAYSGWDTTPRWNSKGIVHINFSKDLFNKQIESALRKAEEGDFLVITAWNEWGEGAILEPCLERENFIIRNT